MNKVLIKIKKIIIFSLILVSIQFDTIYTRLIHSNQVEILTLNKLINKFEAGFLNFTESIGKILKQYEKNINPKSSEAIKAPLRLFIENMQKNPERNHKVFLLNNIKKGIKPPIMIFEDNNLFYYEILPIQYQSYVAAGFSMHNRVMYLNPNYEPNSIFDNLIAFHEIVHSYQDAVFRNYLKTLGEKGKKGLMNYLNYLINGYKDPDLEPIAYAIQFELLNIILKGKLRENIKKYNQIPLNDIAKLIHATRIDKYEILKTLMRYAYIYFKTDSWIYSYSIHYRNEILNDYIKLGVKFYESENKFIKNENNQNNNPYDNQNRNQNGKDSQNQSQERRNNIEIN